MNWRRGSAIVLVAVFGGLLGTEASVGGTENAADARTVRLAIVASLMQDNSRTLVSAFLDPFSRLVQAQTGLTSHVVLGETPAKLAVQLSTDEIQLGVFQGVEFAWVRQAHPSLRPLMIAINQKHRVKAYLVVPADSSARGTADLKGKSLGLPRHSRIHSRLFVEQACQKAGEADLSRFFHPFTTPPNAEEALDDLVDRKFDALVINGVSLESYERRKPGRFSKLKIIQTSETFPPTVVAYRPGSMTTEKLKQFQDGLLNAHQTALGRQLMTLWRLTAFEKVPSDFDDLTSEIVKYYPAPKAMD